MQPVLFAENLFPKTEDIVVCPDCGAPHHRECYQRLGHCALIENHKLGKNWDPPAEPKTESGNRLSNVPAVMQKIQKMVFFAAAAAHA